MPVNQFRSCRYAGTQVRRYAAASLFALMLLLSTMLKAQVSPFSFTRTADLLIYYVNKSGIKLIYDRVLPYARLAVFSGADTSSFTHFQQSAYEIYGITLSSAYSPGDL